MSPFLFWLGCSEPFLFYQEKRGDPTKDYLEIYFGNYLTHTHEIKFTWEKTTQLIEALAKDNNYLDAPEPGQQLSILDEPKTAEATVAPRSQLRVSQDVIDNLLRLGGCTRKSAQRIYGFYRRANDQAENIAFLKREYETDAIGMIIDDRKVSAKWDANGIRISQGEYVSDEYSAFLPWETVDQRIRELLEMGQYLPQVEAEQAEAVWDDYVGEKFTSLYREEFGNIPSEYKTQLERASWDEQKALYVSILKHPQKLTSFLKEIQENAERIKEYPPRYRVWRKPEEMYFRNGCNEGFTFAVEVGFRMKTDFGVFIYFGKKFIKLGVAFNIIKLPWDASNEKFCLVATGS